MQVDPKDAKKRAQVMSALRPEVEKEVLRIPGVVGVSVGFRRKGKTYTDEICFIIYVKRKKARAEIAVSEIIPDKIRGYPTDVGEVEKVAPCSSVRYRPVRAGSRIEQAKSSFITNELFTGTMGCVAEDAQGRIVGLTNHHVLSNVPNPLGYRVDQPTFDDGKNSSCESCTSPSNNVGAATQMELSEFVDCGLFTLEYADGSNLFAGLGDDNEITGTDPAYVCQIVFKVGAASDYTLGIVRETDAVFTMDGQTFRNQVRVLHVPDLTRAYDPAWWGTKKFITEGDSGAVLVDYTNDHVVGLLFGYGYDGIYFAAANNIDRVIAALNIQIPPPFPVPRVAAPPPATGAGWAEDVWQAYRKQMSESPFGRVCIGQIDRNQSEVIRLVHHDRKTKVAWHRNQGPAFLSAAEPCVGDRDRAIPKATGGVQLSALFDTMAEVLVERGSPELAAAVKAFQPDGKRFLECDNMNAAMVETIVISVNRVVADAINRFFSEIARKGYPPLRIPVLDPLNLPAVGIHAKGGSVPFNYDLNVNASSTSLTGIATLKVVRQTYDRATHKARYDVATQLLRATGSIHIKGHVSIAPVDLALTFVADVPKFTGTAEIFFDLTPVPPSVPRAIVHSLVSGVHVTISGLPIPIQWIAQIIADAITPQITSMVQQEVDREVGRQLPLFINFVIGEAWKG